MMRPRHSFETIRDLLAEALVALDSEHPRDALGPIVQARTHAMLQAASLKKAELRAAPAHETMQ